MNIRFFLKQKKETIMKKLAISIINMILPKLVDNFLTPEVVEKYSDKLFDALKKAIKKTENKYDDLLLPVIEALDSVIGEK